MVGAVSGVTQDAPPFSLVMGERARLRGLNVVGMRRRGFPAETRAHIKHAFHVLFQSKLRRETALARLHAELPDVPEVQRLLHFVEASERGVSR
jgi:UDP-N-acetylglucosamine acyltransferase